MCSFRYIPEIEKGLIDGTYKRIFSEGIERSMVQWAVGPNRGQIAANAIGFIADKGSSIPLIAANPPAAIALEFGKVAMQAGQMYQNHKGFTAVLTTLETLQATLGVIQATTALIGVGVVATTVLSAVNLHQTLKLREDVEKLKLEVKNGFLDLKKALDEQGEEILTQIDRVSDDVEFKHHRTVLSQAYGRFVQALTCLRDAAKLQDLYRQHSQVDLARGMLLSALADYDNSQLLADICSAGQLRRKECAWVIHQAITITHQIEGSYAVVSDRLTELRSKIKHDLLEIIESCESEDELDFIFPEISRIYNCDFPALNSWQSYADWMRLLLETEQNSFQSISFSYLESFEPKSHMDSAPLPEQILYEALKQKSHFLALLDTLAFLINPELREEYEIYIEQHAQKHGHKTLLLSNLQQMTNIAVANLYWYFKVRDNSEDISEGALVPL